MQLWGILIKVKSVQNVHFPIYEVSFKTSQNSQNMSKSSISPAKSPHLRVFFGPMNHSPLLGSHSTSVGSHNSAHLWSSQEDPALGNALEPLGFQQKNNSVIYKFVMLVFYRSHYYNGIHYYKTNHVIIMGSIGGKKKCCFIIIGIYIRDLSLVQLFNFKPGTSQVVVSEILDLQIWKKICGEPYCSSCEVYEAWVSTMFNDPKFLWNIHQWLINSQPLLGLEGVAKNYSKNERFPTWWISRRENPTNRKPNPG
jgi:hypothetical protein